MEKEVSRRPQVILFEKETPSKYLTSVTLMMKMHRLRGDSTEKRRTNCRNSYPPDEPILLGLGFLVLGS